MSKFEKNGWFAFRIERQLRRTRGYTLLATNLDTGSLFILRVNPIIWEVLQNDAGDLDPAHLGESFLMEHDEKGRPILWKLQVK